MRKITLFFVFMCLLVWQGNAQILNQAASWPNAAWTVNGSYNATALVNDPTTTTANFSYNDDAAGSTSPSDEVQVESPIIDLTLANAGGETWIQADYSYDYNLGTSFTLEWYDADAGAWVLWTDLPDNSGTTANWCGSVIANTAPILDIAGFTATQLSGFRYRFNYNATGIWGWGVCTSSPTIYSAMPPSCLDPSALTASGITSTTADLGWTDNSGSGTFNIEYGMNGFTQGTGVVISGTTNNPETVTALSPNTAYQFYVQADCGINGTSAWVGPFNFTTLCAPFTAPFLETFTTTSDPTCWSQSSTSGGPWVYTGNPDFGTNPTIVDHTNGVANNYAWVDQSGADVGVILQTPEIDVTALSVPELRFWIMSHNNSGSVSTFNEIHVEASDGLGGWTSVDVISGDFGFQWVDFNYVVSSYTYGANLVQFRFRAESGGDGSDFDNDMLLDDVGVQEAPTCPAPSNLTLNAADLNSATFSWTPGLSESEWALEYGAPGFTPGTGISSLTTNNILETVSGLAPNQFYEIYVRAACSPGDTSTYEGPIQFNTFNQGIYMDWDVACPTGGFIDISTTGTDLGLTDDGEAGITMPFTFLYQGSQQISEVSIGNNGDIKLGTLTGTTSFNGNMNGLADGLYPWLDDLDEETGGVFYETIGTPGNQVFIVQWHQRCNFSGSVGAPNVTFQVQIEEATGEIYYVYDDPIFGGSNAGDDYGANADIGIAGPNQDINVSNNNPQHLMDNSCTHFFYTDCPNPVNFTVTYVNPDEAGITWDPGLATESNWTIIYGLSGFDPTVSGTTITTGTNVAVLTGLDDISDYDVYIFADCNPGTLQSVGGLLGTFTTPPNCSDITALNTATAVDSLFTDWSWTESSGVGTYASTGFNVQYGPLGFNLYSGTTVAADNNFTDTTFDATFLAGGVYEVYVQAVCGVDTSNFVGPVTFTMPLTNDSTCLAETLPVDGMPYSFDNTGATTQANETSIAPPSTGANTTDGWDNSNISFTTWFTFDAPASGSMYVSGIDAGFDGQIAIYEATDCADFATYTLVAANDDALDFSSVAPDFSVCGLTPGNTYYLMHDSWSTFNTGVYSISLREIVVEAGTSNGILDACTGDTINLFDGMAGQDAGGVWYEGIPTANFSDSTFPTAGLAYQVFDFEYVVTDGCAADTSVQQVQIYGPSSAGNDGVLTVCQNEPLNLLNGLSGNVDLGGTWYDPSNNALPGADVTASGIPGSFNYDYITDNGVCPADTANVEVVVSPSCDYANVEELFFGDMDVYPNPTNGVVNITNFGSTEVFSYEITDVKGSVIAGANSAINGSSSTEIDLGGLEMGIYMIRVYNDSAHKTFRIVLQ